MHPQTALAEPAPAGRVIARILAVAVVAMLLVQLVPAEATARGRDGSIRVVRQGRHLIFKGRGFPERARGRIRIETVSGHRTYKKIRSNRNGRWSESIVIGPRRRGLLKVRARVGRDVEKMRVYGVARTTSAKKKKSPTSPTTTSPPPPTVTPAAGLSGPVGPDPDYAPTGVHVAVGQLTQSLLNSNPDGTQFVLAPGVHRMTSTLYPRNRQQILGQPGAVLSGSKLLTTWRREGSWWVADNQTQRLPSVSPASTYCKSGWESCVLSEDVFFDNKVLRQVLSLAELTAGTFYFDYANSRIYIADDPTGHTVETTVLDAAFNGGGTHVTIRNLIIEKFGNPLQTGAVRAGVGWVLERNTARYNHGQGLVGNTSVVVRGNKVHHNGQAALGGTGTGMLVENNEMSHSNTMGLRQGWSTAAAKWYRTDGLVVRNNWVHHNASHALWTDINNINTLYEYNLIEDNAGAGIFHEISYDAVIRHNVIRRSYAGVTDFSWASGAGIKIDSSPNVEIHGNVLQQNPKGVILVQVPRSEAALYGPHELGNMHVHHNDITLTTPYVGLMTWSMPDPSVFYTRAVARFDANTYRLSGAAATAGFSWRGETINADRWRAYGHDLEGSFVYQ